jgi:hypothetical protein
MNPGLSQGEGTDIWMNKITLHFQPPERHSNAVYQAKSAFICACAERSEAFICG